MFYIQRRRKGENGTRRWMELKGDDSQNEDRTPLDAQVYTLNQESSVFEFAVFEQLDAPPE